MNFNLKQKDLVMGDLVMAKVGVASCISGVGMNVPPRVVTNDYFASYLATSDEWIRERTGIVERRWADAGVGLSDLAVPACKQAIENAGLSTSDIDGVICATVTPDFVFPSSACVIQSRLGIRPGLAFDVNAVCTGFVYALVTADALIASGQCSHILVIGADMFSRLIDPNDRGTCVLFGDGAGALVLSSAKAKNSFSNSAPDNLSNKIIGDVQSIRGIYASELSSDGSLGDILCVPKGTAKEPTNESLLAGDHYLKMAGREVFKFAVRALVEISHKVLEKAQVKLEEVDYFVSHQANKRILSAMGKQLGVPEEKVLINVDKYGNTSAASIPLLLAETVNSGKIKRGDLILLSAVGGGITWGAVLVRW